jgi:hypothetical protein
MSKTLRTLNRVQIDLACLMSVATVTVGVASVLAASPALSVTGAFCGLVTAAAWLMCD